MNKVYGIVGLPGSGKDLICDILLQSDHTNIKVIDADKITHQVLEKFSDVIKNNFGDEVFSDGKLDRKLLMDAAFNYPQKMKKHLAFVCPKINKRVLLELQNSHYCRIYINAPFLFEYGWNNYCHEIWFIHSFFETRLDRVKSRGWDEAELKRRDAKFLSVKVLSEKCDRIIVNELSKKHLEDLISLNEIST